MQGDAIRTQRVIDAGRPKLEENAAVVDGCRSLKCIACIRSSEMVCRPALGKLIYDTEGIDLPEKEAHGYSNLGV